jgi:hypothetical protein
MAEQPHLLEHAMGRRSDLLAARIEEGATALAAFAKDLTDAQWRTLVPKDGRTVGVTVHHVASMYPIEMDVVSKVAKGTPVLDVTWDVVAQINATHARDQANVGKKDALQLLQRNSKAAAEAVRRISDADLDRAVPFSLSYGAPMTTQFVIEDHPLRHPWHHLTRIKAALGT